MSQCRICQTPLKPFIDFGRMPRGNGFLRSDQIDKEYFFHLAAALCHGCGMVQLMNQPDPKEMFHDRYPFYSGSSKKMTLHFQRWADDLIKDLGSTRDPFVVEIGSNDGTLLKRFSANRIRHLGIDPAANVAEAAKARSVATLCEFFSQELAAQIVAQHGQADRILAANVICHIPSFHSVAAGIRILLKTSGILQFEEPYWGDVVEKTAYDQIYDEHVFLFSATSLSAALRQHQLELVDVESQSTHGGSMRYTVAHAGAYVPSETVQLLLAKEETNGLNTPKTVEAFRNQCEASRRRLKTTLTDLRAAGKRIAGYAATSKSTTITNYCGITSDLVEYISDTTPLKHGTFSPGVHIPVVPYEVFQVNPPDVALLFAWNHAEEIMEKEKQFEERGGQWILPLSTALCSPSL